MKILKLRMKAFGPYFSEQTIDFTELKDNKMFLIHGQTGAGKTSLLDGITYAIYGDASGSLRENRDLRSHFADEETATEVELTFSVRNTVYRIMRKPEQEIIGKKGGITKKPGEAVLVRMKNGAEELVSDRITNISGEIEKIIGFNAEQFRQVIILPQGEFRKLLESSSSDKEKILTKIFGTEKYSRLQDFIQKKNTMYKDEINALERQLTAILREYDCGDPESLESLLTAEKENLGNLVSGGRKLFEKIEDENRNLQRIINDNRKIRDMLDARHKFEILSSGIEMNRLDNDRLQLSRAALPLRENEIALDRTRKDLDSRTSDFDRVQEDLKNAVVEFEKAKKVFDELSLKKSGMDGESDRLTRLKDKREKLKSFFEMKKDFEYRKSVHIKLSALKERLRSDLDRLRNARKEDTGRIAALGDYDDLIITIAANQNRLDGYFKARKILDENADLQKNIDQAAGNLKLKESGLNSLMTARQKLNDELSDLNDRLIRGQASVLAETLKDGAPCPVCGSVDHPKKAARDEMMPSKDAVEKKKNQIAEIETGIKNSEKEISGLKIDQSSYETSMKNNQNLLKEYDDVNPGQLDKFISKTESLIKDMTLRIDGIRELKKKITDYEKKENETEVNLKKAENDFEKASDSYVGLKSGYENLEKEFDDDEKKEGFLDNKIVALDDMIRKFKESLKSSEDVFNAKMTRVQVLKDRVANASDELSKAKARLRKETENFEDSVRSKGFGSIDEYRSNSLDQAGILSLEEKISRFNGELKSAKDIYEKLLGDAGGLELADVDSSRELIDTMRSEYDKINKLINEKTAVIDAYVRSLANHVRLKQEYDVKIRKAGIIGDISDVVNARGKIPLKTYVLMSYLDEVLEAANRRLLKMCNNRYSFVRSRLVSGTGYKGLEINVFDVETGKERPVSTLSGGEGFVASLSLALGLADVVQSYSGGIEMDTIFIDEGFGSLDTRSLEDAIKTLMEINQKGRLVGIISHVDELKELFSDCRLEVTKTSKGSSARFVVA
jgi:DNA repair protein SbcC/Rad50